MSINTSRIFQDKKRRLGEVKRDDMEQLYRFQETRKFYKKLHASRNGFVPQANMCRGVDGSLLTDEQEVINRWKQHFDEHLNGAKGGRAGGRKRLQR